MSASEVVRASTHVAVDPQLAFEIFTDDIDAWWRSGPRFRFREGETGVLRFEAGPGGAATGRLVEVFDEASGDEFEVGRVLAWEPGARLVFQLGARAFRDDETTEVEVHFEAADGGTRVSVEHRGWERFSAEHPVRHGLRGPAFTDMMGLWWSDLFVSLGRHQRNQRLGGLGAR